MSTDPSRRSPRRPSSALRPGGPRRLLWVLLVPAVLGACEDTTGPENGDSAVEVSTATTGEDLDADGYTAVLAGALRQDVGVVDTVTFAGIAGASYQVELQEVADNCRVEGSNPRGVTVAEADTAATTFSVTCTNLREIAFVSIRDGTDRDVFVKNLSTGTVRNVSQQDPRSDSMPRWSPDGSRLAFVSTRTNDREIWVVQPDGSDPENLTENFNEDWEPRWSPDGSEVAFVSDRQTNDREIWLVDADGSNVRQLTDSFNENFSPDWSPDGSELVFVSTRTGDRELWVMAADGSDTLQLTGNEFGDNYAPRWSPDGSRIAFVSDRTGDEEIFVIDADGSNPRNLSQDFHDDTDPRWSPDGSRIAFVSDRTNDREIWVMDAAGTNQRNLTQDFHADVFPRWSPDGSEIAFVSDRTNDAEVWVMDADGSNPRNVSENPAGQDIEPDWRP